MIRLCARTLRFRTVASGLSQSAHTAQNHGCVSSIVGRSAVLRHPRWQRDDPAGASHRLRQAATIADERRDPVDQRLGGHAPEGFATDRGHDQNLRQREEVGWLRVAGAAMICGYFRKSSPGIVFSLPRRVADWTTRSGMSGRLAPSMSARRAKSIAPFAIDGFTKVTNRRISSGASTSYQSIGESIPVLRRPIDCAVHLAYIRAGREYVIDMLEVPPIFIAEVSQREDDEIVPLARARRMAS